MGTKIQSSGVRNISLTGEKVLKGKIYHGRSEHPILHTWEGSLNSLILYHLVVGVPWWKRFGKGLPPLVELYADLIWSLAELEKGQSVLAEIRPNASYLELRHLEVYRDKLEKQVERSPRVKVRTGYPSKNERWPENIFCKQYIFEIVEKDELIHTLSLYGKLGMASILVLNVDAHLEECARQLQKGFLNEPFDLEEIIERLNALAYCDWLGDRLIIESPKDQLVERFLEKHLIHPERVFGHPLKNNKSHSLWIGSRRILP